MSVIDPYQAPREELLTEEMQEVGEIRFFSPSCRIGRIRYLAHGALIYLGFSLLAAIVIGVAAGVSRSNEHIMASYGAMLFAVAFYVPFFTVYWILMVQRLHDLNRVGWWSLVLFVPVLNVFFMFYLLLWPGTGGSNRFGARPPKNRIWHWLVGLFFPVMIIGILAAVAIPAYQDYSERVRHSH